jgi:hypothetical protein
MSRVKLSCHEEVEFYIDFSELESEAERIIAFLLFSFYEKDCDRYVIEESDLYDNAEKCSVDPDDVTYTLEKFEKKGYVEIWDNLIMLNYDKENAKRKADLTLCMDRDLLEKICDNVFLDVPPDDVRAK